jgi:hypothetical protein
MARTEADIRLAVLKQLAATGVPLTAEAIDAALAGPVPPGTVDPQTGKLQVTEAMLRPGSDWLRSNRAALNAALAADKVEVVD